MPNNAARLDELAAILKATPQRVVPFVGAGCSMAFGLPSWGGLLRSLIGTAADDRRLSAAAKGEVEGLVNDGDFREAASRVQLALGGQMGPLLALTLRQICASPAETEVNDSVLHRLLLLPSKLILTTNYDSIIEDLWFNVRNLPRLRVSTELEPALSAPPDQAWLVKIHGDLDYPRSIVLSEESYQNKVEREQYRANLRTLATSRSLLFLGFGMGDYDLDLVFDGARAESKFPGKHFAVLGLSHAVSQKFRSKLDRWGVHPLWYDDSDGDHRGAVDVMRDLLERLHPGFEAVRYRMENRAMGVVAWAPRDKRTAIVVDGYGNVLEMSTSMLEMNLSDPRGQEQALLFLKERLRADETWTSRRDGRWYVHARLEDLDREIANGDQRATAIRNAVFMLPPERKDSPAKFEYLHGKSGTVARVEAPGVEGTYCFLLPNYSPKVVLPLGTMTLEQCEGVLEVFAGAREQVAEHHAAGRASDDLQIDWSKVN